MVPYVTEASLGRRSFVFRPFFVSMFQRFSIYCYVTSFSITFFDHVFATYFWMLFVWFSVFWFYSLGANPRPHVLYSRVYMVFVHSPFSETTFSWKQFSKNLEKTINIHIDDHQLSLNPIFSIILWLSMWISMISQFYFRSLPVKLPKAFQELPETARA